MTRDSCFPPAKYKRATTERWLFAHLTEAQLNVVELAYLFFSLCYTFSYLFSSERIISVGDVSYLKCVLENRNPLDSSGIFITELKCVFVLTCFI